MNLTVDDLDLVMLDFRAEYQARSDPSCSLATGTVHYFEAVRSVLPVKHF